MKALLLGIEYRSEDSGCALHMFDYIYLNDSGNFLNLFQQMLEFNYLSVHRA